MDTKEQKFKCAGCGSESTGVAGTCCGSERSAVCHACDHVHKSDGSCDCGCDHAHHHHHQ